MIFYFSGTGNSRYIARRFAEALQEPLTDLNAKIRTRDTSPIQTGRDVILIVPTYAWRIPRVISDWLIKTEFASAERIWFVGLRKRDRQRRKIQSAPCGAKKSAVHGNCTDCYAGELHCLVRHTGGRGSRENRREGAAGCGSGNCKRSGGTEISGTPK